MKKRNGREGRVKPFRRGILFLCVLMLLLPCAATAANDGFSTSYTYNFNYWGDVQDCPDLYSVSKVFTSADLGLETRMKSPEGLTVHGDYIYICDTGNNRIIELIKHSAENLEVTRIIVHLARRCVSTISVRGNLVVGLIEIHHLFVCFDCLTI